LSVYTFDETPIEQSFEESLLDESPSLNYLGILLIILDVFFHRLKILCRVIVLRDDPMHAIFKDNQPKEA